VTEDLLGFNSQIASDRGGIQIRQTHLRLTAAIGARRCSRFVSPRCCRGFEMAHWDSGERLSAVGRRDSPLDSMLSADGSPPGR
jgi:hypothetical protein